MSKQALKRVRRALKMEVSRKSLDAFAWPGGYPIVYVFADGGCICPSCANENIREIDEAMRSPNGNKPHSSGCGGWALAGFDVNYEEPDMVCDHCGKFVDPAYIVGAELEAARGNLGSNDLDHA